MPISSIKLLENLIDYCSEKNKVISKNIANIGTEGYRREDIKFKMLLDENMDSHLKTTENNQISLNNSSGLNYEKEYDTNSDKLSGANNVDIDQEMSDLAENSMRFKFASRKIADHYKMLQSVIKGGGSQ